MNPQTETITETLADLIRKRQRYLAQVAFRKLLLWTLLILTVSLMFCALIGIVLLPILIEKVAPGYTRSVQYDPHMFMVFPAMDLVLALCVVCLILAADKQKDRIAKLPVVPPVHEQIAALPDSMKLLRGAQCPSAPVEHLLRPVTSAEHVPPAELLRAHHGSGQA